VAPDLGADSGALAEPTLDLPVEKDDGVLAAREDEIEIAPVDRLLSPPAIDDPPLLTHEGDLLPVDAPRRPVDMGFHQRRCGRV
jgi:hypothetical protein